VSRPRRPSELKPEQACRRPATRELTEQMAAGFPYRVSRSAALEQKQADAERRRHEERLAAMERAIDAEVKGREEQARKEITQAKASEDAAQAAAVARALRR
jgi:hypothetical protein